MRIEYQVFYLNQPRPQPKPKGSSNSQTSPNSKAFLDSRILEHTPKRGPGWGSRLLFRQINLLGCDTRRTNVYKNLYEYFFVIMWKNQQICSLTKLKINVLFPFSASKKLFRVYKFHRSRGKLLRIMFAPTLCTEHCSDKTFSFSSEKIKHFPWVLKLISKL